MIHITKEINNRCWWCGETNNLTGEHKFKKSDIKNALSSLEGDLLHQFDGKITTLQSESSKRLKFSKVLCATCNNQTSQPFDRSYDVFIQYVLNHFELISHNGFIGFCDIFPLNTEENKLNVIKYYVKHFCTRLAQNRFSIDTAIIDFLNGNNSIEKLFIHFEIRADLWGLTEKIKRDKNSGGNFYLSSLITWGDIHEHELVYSYLIVQWFKVEFFYSDKLTNHHNIDLAKFYNSSNNLPVRTLYNVHPDEILSGKKIEYQQTIKTKDEFHLGKYGNEVLSIYF